MRTFVKALVLVPLALVIVFLAVSNRQPATFFFDPLNLLGGMSLTLPLFVFLFATLIAGAVIGYGAAWLAQGRHRRAERHLKRECDRLARECDRLKADVPARQAALLTSR